MPTALLIGLAIAIIVWLVMIPVIKKQSESLENRITKLNPMRAYCFALSAAITVIVASWLGLPVSSTHIAVGAVFGVGFFREWDAERRIKKARMDMPDRPHYAPEERRHRKLVRRSHFMTIIAAWVITVPAAALLSGLIFFLISTVIG